MVYSSHGRLDKFFTIAILILASLAACEREVQGPEAIATYTFSKLIPKEAVGFRLETEKNSKFLIRVEGHEVNFESRILRADGQVLSAARLPYLRVGPVFQVLEIEPEDVALNLSIHPRNFTKNASIKVLVYSLPNDSKSDIARTGAFKNYAQAIQSTDDESPEVWKTRVETLQLAASGFKRSGDTEMQLWAEYLQAYFLYFPLAANESAIDRARALQEQAHNSQQQVIELMALQLEGQVLVERDENDSLEEAKGKFNRAQEVLERAVDLADQLDMQYEKAWAINTRGIGYFYQDLYAEAESQYEQALNIARELEDEYLVNLMRGNLALVHERQGHLYQALAALHDINGYVEKSGSKADLAQNWFELSRLYQKLFLIPQTIDAQNKALQLWRELDSAEGIGRSLLLLSRAYLAIGQEDMALPLIVDAIEYMETANYGRGLRDGLGLIADIFRSGSQFEQMSAARNRQNKFLTSVTHQSQFEYERGLDALAQYPDDPGKAGLMFEAAERLALQANDRGLSLRSRLQICTISASPDSDLCIGPELQRDLDEWLLEATLSQELEARFLLARTLVKFNQQSNARELLGRLIKDIQLYRHSLPGVLGAWYWQSRWRIFRTYMSLSLADPDQGRRAIASLLALNQLLNTSRHSTGISSRELPFESPDVDRLRNLIALLETGDEEGRLEARQAIDQELLAQDRVHRSESGSLNRSQLVELLSDLPDDSVLLAYYFAEDGVWAWSADRLGVRLFQISDSNDVSATLDRVRRDLRTVGHDGRDQDLQSVGDLLLSPLERSLPRTVYLLAVGELAGFPFEAIRRNDHYFGQDHDVINLMSLVGLRDIQSRNGDAQAWLQIMLAGDPMGQGGELPRAAQEIDSIAALFDGRDVTRLTREQLVPGLLQNSLNAEMDLFHIASHGQINLQYPELSRLMLSDESATGADTYLTPLDISRVQLTADLVVLSACETTGVSAFTFDSNLGFVTEFLEAGAGSVVASLWPVSDSFAREFMLDFYRSMLDGMSSAQALANAKRLQISRNDTETNLEWASFQLYSR